MATKYKIVRHYFKGTPNHRTIKNGLTLEQAQEHCRDKETSSTTCTTSAGKLRTRQYGMWFDGYTEE